MSKFVLNAELNLRKIIVGADVKKQLQSDLQIRLLTPGATATKKLRLEIAKGLEAGGGIVINNIHISNTAVRRLRQQIQNIVDGLGTFHINVDVRQPTSRRGRTNVGSGSDIPVVSRLDQQIASAKRFVDYVQNLTNISNIPAQTRQRGVGGRFAKPLSAPAGPRSIFGNGFVLLSQGQASTLQDAINRLRAQNAPPKQSTGTSVIVRQSTRGVPVGGLVPGGFGAGGTGLTPPGFFGNAPEGPPIGPRPKTLQQTIRDLKLLNTTFEDSTTELEKFGRIAGNTFRRFLAYNLVTSIFYSLNNAVSESAQRFIDFDKQFIRVAQITGASDKAVAGLADRVRDLSTGLGVSSLELFKSAETLAQAGFSIQDLPDILDAVAKSDLAPTFESQAETVEGLIAILNQFKLSAKDTNEILSVTNAVSARFAVESGDIIQAVRRAGGAFASANRDIGANLDGYKEFIAVFTSVRQTTRESAETIATGLRTIATRLQRPETIDFLQQFGIDLEDAQGNFIGFTNAVFALNQALVRLQNTGTSQDIFAILEKVGGFRQVSKVLPLVTEVGVLQDALATAQLGGASLDIDAIKAQDALANSFVKVREELDRTIDAFGNSRPIRNFINLFTELLKVLPRVGGLLENVALPLSVFAGVKAIRSGFEFFPGFAQGLTGRTDASGRRIADIQAFQKQVPSAFINQKDFESFRRLISAGNVTGGNNNISTNIISNLRNAGLSSRRIEGGVLAPGATTAQREFFGLGQVRLSLAREFQRLATEARKQQQLGLTVNKDLAEKIRNVGNAYNQNTIALGVLNQQIIRESSLRARVSNGLREFASNPSAIGGTVLGAAVITRGLLGEGPLSFNADRTRDAGVITRRATLTGVETGATTTAVAGGGIAALVAGGAITGPIGLATLAIVTLGTAVAGVTKSLIDSKQELDQLNYEQLFNSTRNEISRVEESFAKIGNSAQRRIAGQNILGLDGGNQTLRLLQLTGGLDKNDTATAELLKGTLLRFVQSSPNVQELLQSDAFLNNVTRIADINTRARNLPDSEFNTGFIREFNNLIKVFEQIGSFNKTLEQFDFSLTQSNLVAERFNDAFEQSTFDAIQFSKVFNSLSTDILFGNLNNFSSNFNTSSFLGPNARFVPDASVANISQFSPLLANLVNRQGQDINKVTSILFNTLADGFKDIDLTVDSTTAINDALLNAFNNANIGTEFISILQNAFGGFGDNLLKELEQIRDTGQISAFVDNIFSSLTEPIRKIIAGIAERRSQLFDFIVNTQFQSVGFNKNIRGFSNNVAELSEQILGTKQIPLNANNGNFLNLPFNNNTRLSRIGNITDGLTDSQDIFNSAKDSISNSLKLQQLLDESIQSGDENKIRALALELANSVDATQRFKQGLEELTNTQEQSADVQRKLNDLEKQKQSFLSIGERLFLGDRNAINQINRGSRLVNFVSNQGGLQGLGGAAGNLQVREDIVNFLRLIGDIQLPGRDITGNQLLEKIFLNTVDPRLQNQFVGAQENLRGEQINILQDAQKAFIALEGLANLEKELFAKIRQDQENLAQKFLEQEISQAEIGIKSANINIEGQGFARGGQVRGGQRGKDSVPALLMPGEFVINAFAANKNLPLIKALNDNKFINSITLDDDLKVFENPNKLAKGPLNTAIDNQRFFAQIISENFRLNNVNRRRQINKINALSPLNRQRAATKEQFLLNRDSLIRNNQENQIDKRLFFLRSRGLNPDEQSLNQIIKGRNIQAVETDLKLRTINGNVGNPVLNQNGVRFDRENQQLQQEKMAENVNKFNNAVNNIPKVIDFKVNDFQIDVRGIDLQNAFNQNFIQQVSEKVAIEIQKQGKRLFDRKPD